VAKYGDIVYGGAKYGDTPKLSYSVAPFTVNVIQFNEADLSWANPIGVFTRFRIVRNQNGFPETSEDGVIVYEVTSPDGSNLSGSNAMKTTTLKDGVDNTDPMMYPNYISIIPGKNIYYRAFLYTDQQVWVKAGDTYDVVPADTDAMKSMLNLLPRTLVSDVLSPFGVVPHKEDAVKSTLYNFLDGFAFTYEQMLTQIGLLKPSHNVDPANYNTIAAEAFSVGMEPEPNLPVVNQRRLIRDAIYLYSTKGTALGLKNYAESLTGFGANITVSNNQMLSIQDSTFYHSTGNWVGSSSVTSITSTTESLPPQNVHGAIDKAYTLKVVTNAAGTITLGMTDVLGTAIPYSLGSTLAFEFYAQTPTTGATITPSVSFLEEDDTVVHTYTDFAHTVNSSWALKSQGIYADPAEISDAKYIGLQLAFSKAGTYYIDMVSFGTANIMSNYDEARAVTVELQPFMENYVPNPSFEVDSNYWTLTNLTFESDPTSYPLDGFPSIHSGKFTATDTTWSIVSTVPFPVEAGKYFNVSMYAMSTDIPMMDMTIDIYNGNGEHTATFADTHMMNEMWMRHYVGGLVDIFSQGNQAIVTFSGTSTPGQVFHLDMVQAQDTYRPTDYFDASMPASVGVIWEAATNGSASLYYPGKDVKFLRLAQTLQDWLPMNAWWRITTPRYVYGGGDPEYTNLTV